MTACEGGIPLSDIVHWADLRGVADVDMLAAVVKSIEFAVRRVQQQEMETAKSRATSKASAPGRGGG